jgi:hypothetical protein
MLTNTKGLSLSHQKHVCGFIIKKVTLGMDRFPSIGYTLYHTKWDKDLLSMILYYGHLLSNFSIGLITRAFWKFYL